MPIWIWYLDGHTSRMAPAVVPLLDRAATAARLHVSDILLLSTRLTGAMHNDPADRMLIAASQLYSLPLVTADGLIVDYAAAHPGTTVVDARQPRAAAPRKRSSQRRKSPPGGTR